MQRHSERENGKEVEGKRLKEREKTEKTEQEVIKRQRNKAQMI